MSFSAFHSGPRKRYKPPPSEDPLIQLLVIVRAKEGWEGSPRAGNLHPKSKSLYKSQVFFPSEVCITSLVITLQGVRSGATDCTYVPTGHKIYCLNTGKYWYCSLCVCFILSYCLREYRLMRIRLWSWNLHVLWRSFVGLSLFNRCVNVLLSAPIRIGVNWCLNVSVTVHERPRSFADLIWVQARRKANTIRSAFYAILYAFTTLS